MAEIFTQISSAVKFKNPYWEYKFDRYVLPNGSEGEYHYVNSRGAAMIIPVTQDKKLVTVSQFRYLNQKESIEFPGGGISEGSDGYNTAVNELKEEAGIISNNIIEIGEYNPYNGVTNEITRIFAASDIIFEKTAPEETEQIAIRLLSVEEFEAAIQNNLIWDGMTLAAWSLFKYSKYFGEIL